MRRWLSRIRASPTTQNDALWGWPFFIAPARATWETPMKLLTWDEVQERIGGEVSRSTVWRWERSGDFPSRRKVGPNSVRWVDEEVDRWIRGLPVGSTAGAAEGAS